MAGSSSSSGGLCKHDVFLSFSGKDTRKIFVGHLYRALKQKAIDAFIDSEDLSKGNKISELLKAIEDSRISIVVLSENYASSSWCLEELVKILECMDTKNQIVKPIFYEVAPDDIRNLDGKFGEAFDKEFGGADKQELETWRSALTRVADLSGWVSTKYEDDGKLVEEIVEDTLENWIRISPPCKDTGLVGMDSHIKEMKLRLCLEKDDVRFVGIWGMGGIGKTTIAGAVYDEIACQFENAYFLDHVNDHFANKREAILQEKLLSGLLKDKGKIECLSRGRNLIMQKLGKKKVLVVLDDVGNSTQIEVILGNQDFGVGSRIIITTRYKQSLSGVRELYEPEKLCGEEADELFMKHAFRKNQPTKDYNHLSRRAIEYAKGLPLALKVLGASLCDKNEDEWKHVLEKLRKTPNIEILDVLKTSMEGLDDLVKDIFLDIACFFKEMPRDLVKEFLNGRGFIPDAGLMVLVDKALITISDDKCIDMHDLLQEMGREIARQEYSKYPGRRSRLWRFEDVDVLTKSTGKEAVECMILDLWESKIDLKINTGGFVRMTNLRLLMIYNFWPFFEPQDQAWEDFCRSDGCKQHVIGDLEFLSNELRFLCWHECPLKSLPSKFNPENLLRLDMGGSHIQQLWEGIKSLKKLKLISLNSCNNLVKTPDLTEVTNLETLVLDNCTSLIEVHPSISALQKLLMLSLKGCKELKILPTIIHMKSLQTLILSGCSKIDKFPDIYEEMEKLECLHLDDTAIKEVPSSINNLTSLLYLDLTGCRELERLPSTIHMKSLQKLFLSGCSKIDKFPEISKEMEKLEDLRLDETAIKEVPSSIKNLTSLLYLDLTDCKELERLPSTIHMKSLQKLFLYGCSKIDKFPEISEEMEKLEDLSLAKTAIKEVPSAINNLRGLLYLDLIDCRELERLPSTIHMKSLQKLFLSGCSKIDKFPEISEEMEKLEDLCLDETAIKEVPSSINNLTGLLLLNLTNCRELERLPSTIHMKSLQKLILSGCSKIDKFPEISEEMEQLEDLRLDKTAIKELPSSINNLTSLLYLDLTGCRELERLPSTIHIKSLQTLGLSGCLNLEKFPEFSEEMENLEVLRLADTAIEEVSSSINNLTSLFYLDLTGCRELQRLPSTIHMKSLQTLCLSGCLNLQKFPDFSEEMEKLEDLHLAQTAIKEVPSSINNLTGLLVLNLTNCRELERLPSTIHISLQKLILSGCSKIDKLPKISEEMEKLEDLILDKTAIKEVPSSINNLTRLLYLDLTNCRELERLPSTIHMKSLQKFFLSGCSKIDKFPEISEEMEKLDDLRLDKTAIKEVPSSINNLTGLLCLDLTACKELERLPSTIHMQSLQKLSLSGCSNLEKFPEFSEEMEKLEDLCLAETAIKEVPSSINNLTGLLLLNLTDCRKLERLPSTIHMKSLQKLILSGCSKIDKFPEISEEMEKLEDLRLDETAIKEMPSSINNLTSLLYLDLTSCKELERLPSTIHMKSLQTLGLSGCTNLEKFPEFSEEMEKLVFV